MRLGGPVFADCSTPEDWVAGLRRHGYTAAYGPVGADADEGTVAAYARAAREADIVIAEVGAWSNPVSPDEDVRRQALALCQRQLDLADRIGALCCVNISGSRGEQWDGPHPDNLTDDTFDLVVESVRSIIDGVRPTRAFYTLETMPWMYPDSTESYERLIRAIDRKQFAVHFDPVNLICSPQRYFSSGPLITDFVEKLGPHIKSCHAKDISLSGKLTVHLDEICPGLGGLDFPAFLRALDRLDPDTPLLAEHLSTEEEFSQAVRHIRSVAASEGIVIR